MDTSILLFLGLIVGILAVYGAAIGGSIDALGQPREAWQRAGFRRSRWVWQAFGVLVVPVGLAYSGVYFVRVRPRLVAASRDIAIERGASRVHPQSAEVPTGPRVDVVKIRVPPSVVGTMALALILGYAIASVVLVLSVGDDWALIGRQFIIWSSTALVITTVNLAFGINLTPHDLVMRGLFRRHVSWSDVVAITQESKLGTRYVRLWARTGRGRRLRAPFTQLGVGRRRFDEDFAVLEQWWLAHTPASG